MKVLDRPISKPELEAMASKMFVYVVKAVVDIEREIVAIDGELHSDLAEMLVEQGSKGKNIWGVNIHPDKGSEWLEFDSMVNIKPNLGNRTRSVDDPIIRDKIRDILESLIKR